MLASAQRPPVVVAVVGLLALVLARPTPTPQPVVRLAVIDAPAVPLLIVTGPDIDRAMVIAPPETNDHCAVELLATPPAWPIR